MSGQLATTYRQLADAVREEHRRQVNPAARRRPEPPKAERSLALFDRAILDVLRRARGIFKSVGMPVRTLAVVVEYLARPGVEGPASNVNGVLPTPEQAAAWRRALNQRLRRTLARLERAGLVKRGEVVTRGRRTITWRAA